MLKLAAVLAAVVSLAGAAPLAGTAAGSSQTVAATADAFVNAASPDSNYGGDARLYTDGSPVFRSYLRFDLSGLAGRVVTKATLQIHAETDGATGETIEVRGADSSWTEDGITYENAPSPGAIIDSAGQVSAGSWVSLDVTPLVSVNGAATFVVDSQDDTRIRFASRETSTPPRLVVETTAATPQPAFPIRAAFYYPWFPEAWNQSGLDPYTHYTPSLGYYDSSAAATITSHIHALEYGNFQAAIASWWGQGTPTDGRFPQLLSTTDSLGSPLKWAVYYEAEGVGNPSASQIASDLVYLRDHYASDQAYLRVNGRFVVFAFADSGDGCGMADRWKQANDSLGDPAYVVLKVFSGYRTCASQPDGWHQYGASSAEDSQSGYSFSISPGYWKAGQSTPLLSRDPTRFAKNVADMIASSAPWQLVTTFDEWGEGTAVESASQWASSSGYGAYLDILHANGSGTPSATAPSNSAAPTVSGTAQQGQTLAATTGTWSGTAPISYAYQWRRCDSAGGTCASISGATSQSYLLVSGDVGSTIRVRVTASNSAGSSTADSSQTSVVRSNATAPSNSAAPTVSGTAQQGQTLTATTGTWSGTAPISYAYQWRRCDSSGGACASISGATSQTYVLASADAGATVRVQVTASNSGGNSTVSSNQTAVVQANPSATAPSNSAAPTVSGTAQQGQTLAATTGTWSGTAPISYAYQWRRCDSAGGTCASISGATSQSYLLVSGDVGSTIRVRVTASNSAGSSTADSSQTAVVQTAPASTGPCGTAAAAPATWKHVIWIWMENHSYSEIVGSSSAPYLNQLASECGLATNYHGVVHPSLPNYIAATSGGTQGITDDNPPSSHPLAVASIFSQVAAAGLTWRSYEESMSSNCALSSSGSYAVKHNPAVYYTGIRTQCASWDVPMGTTSAGAFRSDLQNDALPSFSFVTPNLCNDMHDCGVSTGDAWLKSWVPLILSSPGYASGNTVLVITWDEDDGSTSNQVATIVASPSTPAGTRSGTLFNHYSLLRTAEEQLGLPATLGAAATATSMRSAFHY